MKIAGLWIAGLLLLYALLGFLLLPALLKRQLLTHVERDLGHQLAIGTLRINPFRFTLEATDLALRESTGAPLLAVQRLFVDFEASSLFRRVWRFAAVELAAPSVHVERRLDGSHNFNPLLARLQKTPPDPQAPMPRLEIARIALTDGRIELADLPAGEQARLILAPIAFELTALSTFATERSPYSLSAQTPEGERLQWGGEIAISPFASSGRLALQGWRVGTLARVLGKRIDLHAASGQANVTLDYRAAFDQGAVSFSLANTQVTLDDLALTASAGQPPLVAAKRIALANGSFDLAERRVAIERLELIEASTALRIDAQGAGNWSAVLPQPPPAAARPVERSMPRTSNAPPPSTSEPPPAARAPPPPQSIANAMSPAATDGWSVRLGNVRAQRLRLQLTDERPGAEATVSVEPVDLGSSATLQIGPETLAAVLDKVSISAGTVAVAAAELNSRVESFSLAATRLRWQARGAEAQLDVDGLGIDAADAAVTSTTRTLRLNGLATRVEALAVALPSGGTPSVALKAAQARSAALGARVGNQAELIEVADIVMAAHALTLSTGSGASAQASGISVDLGPLRARHPGAGSELARIGTARARIGAMSTLERRVDVESLLLEGGQVAVGVGKDGRHNWQDWLEALAPASPGAAARTAARGTPTPPWAIGVKSVQLRNFAAGYTDLRQQPALSLKLVEVNAGLRNFSTAAAAPAGVELAARIENGGHFSAAGSVHPQTFASDLKVKLTDLSLLPAQPFLAQRARLKLVSALASADGRLRYGLAKAAGADVVFEGELRLQKVDIEETEPAQPFLAFESLRAAQMKLTLGPGSLDVPDLRVDRLATKIVIGEDQTLNLLKVVRTPASNAPPTAPAASSAAAPPASEDAEPAFPVSVARIRLDRSIVEFADLSLRPQFSTRMHELQGVITGVSTTQNTRARLELEARVDEFGSAQISGTINAFRPRAFTAIDMDFRNIEMASLTPYSAKFAGYRIAAGRLSTTLQYRVKNSVLQGDNKIVIDQLELGERVESPTAMNLPLELAIALLKDDNGRIDIGLQVTGSLEDPQFSIAALVWKAIGNLFSRIVTAPFRALGRLFGGADAEEAALGVVAFDPGLDALRPPERQKLKTVAEALQKRPQLALTIKPTFSPSGDRAAMQSVAARSAVLRRAGIQLEPGESPGPLDVGNARIRRAIEDEFVERFGMPALRDLRAELAKRPATAARGTGADPPSSDTQAAAAASPDAGSAVIAPAAQAPAPRSANLAAIRLARAMSERMIEAETVSDDALVELGKRRGEAIAQTLRSAGNVEPARVTTAAPRAVDDAEGSIDTSLDLAVAK